MSESSAVTAKKPLLSDGAYNKLKHTAAIALPAAAAFYIALAQIWHLPKVEEVAGSIASVNTFLGVVLGLSTRTYNNSDNKYIGAIHVSDDGEKKVYSLIVNGDPEALDTMKDATFKVNTGK
jgi:hypothetical protein